jgi:predicted Zn-dependent protease
MTAQERSILEGLANETLSQAMRLGCDDISVICANSKDSQVRFANNSITLVNNIQDLAIWMYVSKQKRRIVGVSYNPTSAGVEKFVSNLVKSCEALP